MLERYFQCESNEAKLRYDLLVIFEQNPWIAELFAQDAERAAQAASRAPLSEQVLYAYQRGICDAYCRIVETIQKSSSTLLSIHQFLDGDE